MLVFYHSARKVAPDAKRVKGIFLHVLRQAPSALAFLGRGTHCGKQDHCGCGRDGFARRRSGARHLRRRFGEFRARALTRDPNSEKAQALAALGAEVVACNVDNEASLRTACEGAYGVYGVTFFWDHFSPEREKAQAAAIAGAAQAAGAAHVIWSTLEDSRKFIPLDDTRMPTLQGRYKVPHFDAKAEADAVFAALPPTC